MNIGQAALIGALVWKLLDFAKSVRAKNVNASVTQAVAWAIGIGVLFLCSAAKVTNTYQFNHTALVDMDAGSKILVGMQVTSLFASVPFDFKKSLDGTDSAATPPLVPPTA